MGTATQAAAGLAARRCLLLEARAERFHEIDDLAAALLRLGKRDLLVDRAVDVRHLRTHLGERHARVGAAHDLAQQRSVIDPADSGMGAVPGLASRLQRGRARHETDLPVVIGVQVIHFSRAHQRAAGMGSVAPARRDRHHQLAGVLDQFEGEPHRVMLVHRAFNVLAAHLAQCILQV